MEEREKEVMREREVGREGGDREVGREGEKEVERGGER